MWEGVKTTGSVYTQIAEDSPLLLFIFSTVQNVPAQIYLFFLHLEHFFMNSLTLTFLPPIHFPIPTDHFNGITTAYTATREGKFTKVDFASSFVWLLFYATAFVWLYF